MPRGILLDSAPLSVLASPPESASAQAITQWAFDCDAAGHRIIIPEIVDYEVRRELLRSRKSTSVAALDDLKTRFTFLPLTSPAMLKAAELWAQTRQQGKPTSHDQNIDVDVILAGKALTLDVPPADIVVATVNLRHLSLFVKADFWTNIRP